MTLRASKPSFNVREKLNQLERPIGVKGNELMRAETLQDARDLVSAGRKNLIINGAMQVAQRATQVTSVTASGVPQTCDRFHVWIGTLGTWTIDQSTDAPDGFSSSLKVTCTTADASPTGNDYAYFSHRIEGQNLQHLNYGSSAARQLTLSFWVKSNKTGNSTVVLLQRDNSNKLLSLEYTVSSANTWEYKTISIPADTSGLINNDNGLGLELEFPFNTGPGYSGGTHQTTWNTYNSSNRYVSTLGVGGATSDYFAITGVQLEVGRNATEFEHRSYGEELALCQRYYQKHLNPTLRGVAGSSTALNRMGTSLPVTMRDNPVISVEGTFSWYDGNITGTFTSANIASSYSRTSFIEIEAAAATGTTATYRPIVTYITGTASYLICSSEL